MTEKEILDLKIKMIQSNLLTKKPEKENEDLLIEKITSTTSTPLIEKWRTFFLSDFSKDFLNRISYDLYGESGDSIMGDYYMFISPAGGENSIPYYKVSLFSRYKDAKLKSYLSVITSRYFYTKRKKELAVSNQKESLNEGRKLINVYSGNNLIENSWFALLITNNDEIWLSENNIPLAEKLKNMIKKLPAREQAAIELTYYGNCSGEEIFDELLTEGLINPKRQVDSLTSKDKQDAVANIRKRAIKHLQTLMQP